MAEDINKRMDKINEKITKYLVILLDLLKNI